MTPYEHLEKILKKKKTKHIYIAHTHTQLPTEKKQQQQQQQQKKQTNKQTHPRIFFSIYSTWKN